MIRIVPNKIFAGLLLLVLLVAYAGQEVHILNEDPARFAALSGDLLPDNGATSRVVERCAACEYHFFPYLYNVQFTPAFYSAGLGLPLPQATHCKAAEALAVVSLRAPPTR